MLIGIQRGQPLCGVSFENSSDLSARRQPLNLTLDIPLGSWGTIGGFPLLFRPMRKSFVSRLTSMTDSRCESRRESGVIIVSINLDRVHEMHVSRVAFIKTVVGGRRGADLPCTMRTAYQLDICGDRTASRSIFGTVNM